MSASRQLIVIRIGGSLLDLPALHCKINQLLNRLQPARILLITGGGHAAETIRQLDQRFTIHPSLAHWQAIAAMSFNANVLVRTGRHLKVVTDPESAGMAWETDCTPVLDPLAWLRGPGRRVAATLPHSWHVTSDSIAAAVLHAWDGQRLILAKSCSPPARNIRDLAAAGAVDLYLPQIAEMLTIEWCCLRNSEIPRLLRIHTS